MDAMPDQPCRNPNCKSYGKIHPNCRCYAAGGLVSACALGSKHSPECHYYADGGEVKPKSPGHMVGHAAAHSGLAALLKNAGKASLAEPEKHNRMLHDAKNHWERMQTPEGADEPASKTVGVRLANHLTQGDHEKAADMMHGHPTMGSMHKSNLPDALKNLQGPLMSNEPNAEALKSAMDFMHSAHKGENALKDGANGLFDRNSDQLAADELLGQALKNHLKELEENPEKLAEIGGNLGHYMPEHATQLAYTFARASDYLGKIKPKPVQLAPLDSLLPPNDVAQKAYDRQVQNVAQPQLLYKRIKNGTIQPIDVTTVQTVYPEIHQSMIEKTMEALTEAKSKNKFIPYTERMGVSILLGQPIDFTLTPQAAQAIMQSQAGVHAPQQQVQKKKSDKATEVELKQINKSDEAAETPIESRQLDKKD